MPTATNFACLSPFTPGMCAESKTTAQLDALNRARYEDASLTNIMALWWNLYTVTLASTEGTASASGTSLPFVFGGAGDAISDLRGYTPVTPRDRVCAPFDGVAAFEGIATANAAGAAIDIGFCMGRIYFNTTTSKYSLLVQLVTQDPVGDIQGATFDLGVGSVSNGGAFTIFGATVPSWKKDLTTPNINASVSSPTYFTY